MVILEKLDNPHRILVDVFTEAVTQSFERKVGLLHLICVSGSLFLVYRVHKVMKA